jgi:hypothetical protein
MAGSWKECRRDRIYITFECDVGILSSFLHLQRDSDTALSIMLICRMIEILGSCKDRAISDE